MCWWHTSLLGWREPADCYACAAVLLFSNCLQGKTSQDTMPNKCDGIYLQTTAVAVFREKPCAWGSSGSWNLYTRVLENQHCFLRPFLCSFRYFEVHCRHERHQQLASLRFWTPWYMSAPARLIGTQRTQWVYEGWGRWGNFPRVGLGRWYKYIMHSCSRGMPCMLMQISGQSENLILIDAWFSLKSATT